MRPAASLRSLFRTRRPEARPHTGLWMLYYARNLRSKLGNGVPAAQTRFRLMLLGSPPDMVHGLTLRGTDPSSPLAEGRRHSTDPGAGIHPRCSGLRVQGTAISPTSAALLRAGTAWARLYDIVQQTAEIIKRKVKISAGILRPASPEACGACPIRAEGKHTLLFAWGTGMIKTNILQRGCDPMRHAARLLALLLALAALAGCTPALSGPEELDTDQRSQFYATLEHSLGALDGRISEQERQEAEALLLQIWPIRQKRLENNWYYMGRKETGLVEEYSRLLDQYTARYIGEDEGWWYESPEMVDLVDFLIQPNGILTAPYFYDGWKAYGYTREEAEALWEAVRGVLPDGAFEDFTYFSLFTDGYAETVAYVYWDDSSGVADTWGLALDPADVTDWDYFLETILHEYCHYLTLNESQARCDQLPGSATYSEPGLVTKPGSYLDDFYQEFWGFLADERRVNDQSTAFFYRHYDDFYSAYATTDPSEDIAESFACFVLWEDDWDGAREEWERKIRFFYDYPELVEFRDEVRARLELDAAA